MPDTRDPESVIQAAEQAAVSGDYAAAERLLREAADLQETSLGPLHPELANTLNNLGVVYEVTEKPEQAERCFRRASEIAAAVLPADHPFVATSRQNLEDFLATRAKAALPLVPPPAPTPAPAPVQAPPAAPPPAPSTPPPAVVHPQGDLQEKADRVETAERAAQRSTSDSARAAATQTLSYSTRETTSAVEDRRKPRTMAIGGLLAAGLLVTLIAIGLWFRGGAATQPSSATPLAAPAERPAPVAEPKPSAPTPAVEPRAGAAKEVRRTEPGPARNGPAASSRTKSAVPKNAPVVAGAQLCGNLVTSGAGGWRCDPPARPVARGRLLFYTRLKSPTNTTVQHRWYHGDRLQKAVNLAISTNTGSGYRTYSRNIVTAPGEWRVELTTRDGVLLHAERFTVR